MDDETLPHVVAGPRGGPPVFFVHPLGADHTFWNDTRSALASDAFTISCGLRGARGAPLPTEPVTAEQSARDIEAIRDHLGIDAMVVVGCAIGSMTAVTYAARYPARVTGLVLSNPGTEITDAASENLRHRADAVRKGGMRALLPEAIERAFKGCEDSERRFSYERDFLTQPPEGYAMAALGACHSSIKEDLALIKVPTLLVAGGKDVLLPPRHAEFIHARLPASELIVMEDGAHFIPYQRPEEFADIVKKFVET